MGDVQVLVWDRPSSLSAARPQFGPLKDDVDFEPFWKPVVTKLASVRTLIAGTVDKSAVLEVRDSVLVVFEDALASARVAYGEELAHRLGADVDEHDLFLAFRLSQVALRKVDLSIAAAFKPSDESRQVAALMSIYKHVSTL